MRVRRDEGLAIHAGPKPCIGTREGDGEASAGDCVGQPLSRESDLTWDADAVSYAEGDTGIDPVGNRRGKPVPGRLARVRAQSESKKHFCNRHLKRP